MYHLQATAKCIFTVHAYRIATVKISRLHSTHFVEITVRAFTQNVSSDWIKFDTHLIISVQLLIRKRKAEKYSYVFKKKKSNNEQNESDRI